MRSILKTVPSAWTARWFPLFRADPLPAYKGIYAYIHTYRQYIHDDP